jgi:hypothetical protein
MDYKKLLIIAVLLFFLINNIYNYIEISLSKLNTKEKLYVVASNVLTFAVLGLSFCFFFNCKNNTKINLIIPFGIISLLFFIFSLYITITFWSDKKIAIPNLISCFLFLFIFIFFSYQQIKLIKSSNLLKQSNVSKSNKIVPYPSTTSENRNTNSLNRSLSSNFSPVSPLSPLLQKNKN